VRAAPQRVVIPLTAHSAGDIVAAPREEARYRMPGLVADGVISAYGGSVGHGKTPSTVAMLAAMLNGGEYLGIEVERVPDDYKIAYLTQESLNTFQPLLLGAGITPDEQRLHVFYAHEVFASGQTWPQVVEGLTTWLGGKGLLVVDTFRTFARLRNEKDDSEVSEAMVPVVQAVGSGIGAWLVMHTWKTMQDVPDEDTDVMHFLAAGELTAVAGICTIYRKPKSGRENERYFKVVRNRFGNELDPRYVELVDGKLQVVSHMTQALRVHNDHMRKVEAAIEADPGKKMSVYVDATGLSQQRVSDAVKALEDDGLVHRLGTPRSRTNPLTFHPGAGPTEEEVEAAITTPMSTEQIWHEP
jgi:DNA-binding Lrp family transcriptional regulator